MEELPEDIVLDEELEKCITGDYDFDDPEQVARCEELFPPTGAGVEVSLTSISVDGEEWFIILVLLMFPLLYAAKKFIDKKFA